jgi:hypothetical protein
MKPKDVDALFTLDPESQSSPQSGAPAVNDPVFARPPPLLRMTHIVGWIVLFLVIAGLAFATVRSIRASEVPRTAATTVASLMLERMTGDDR